MPDTITSVQNITESFYQNNLIKTWLKNKKERETGLII